MDVWAGGGGGGAGCRGCMQFTMHDVVTYSNPNNTSSIYDYLLNYDYR